MAVSEAGSWKVAGMTAAATLLNVSGIWHSDFWLFAGRAVGRGTQSSRNKSQVSKVSAGRARARAEGARGGEARGQTQRGALN